MWILTDPDSTNAKNKMKIVERFNKTILNKIRKVMRTPSTGTLVFIWCLWWLHWKLQ